MDDLIQEHSYVQKDLRDKDEVLQMVKDELREAKETILSLQQQPVAAQQ